MNRVAPPDIPFLQADQGATASPGGRRLSDLLGGIVDAKTTGAGTRESVDPKVKRADALTILRHKLTALCDARICLGGKRRGFSGWFPGIAEEAKLAIDRHQPLYCSGIFGGVSRDLAISFARNQASRVCAASDRIAGRTPLRRWLSKPPRRRNRLCKPGESNPVFGTQLRWKNVWS